MMNKKDSNYTILKSADLELRPGGTVKFEGAAYDLSLEYTGKLEHTGHEWYAR
jgi:hypothetical protein